MIKHIVMFKVNDTEDKPAVCKNLKAELETLKNKISEIKDYEVGINITPSPAAYDIVLVSGFEDEAALERYRKHPAHLEVVELINQQTSQRCVVDYNI